MMIYGGCSYFNNWIHRGRELSLLKNEVLLLKWLTKRTARHEYFMASPKRSYSYGNKNYGEESYESEPFSRFVKIEMDRLNAVYGTEFNACFLNKYDNQHQHLGWHADDFEGMRSDQPIGIISLGAEREIWLKKKEEKGHILELQKVLLRDGSLFFMPVGFQNTHLHRIPKHGQPCEWRISLTFRSFK